MSNFVYKALDKTMIKEVTKMFVTTFNSEPWNEQWTYQTASARLLQWLKWEHCYGIVCYDNGILCGVILGHEEQDYNGTTFTIREFCVDNTMRGIGIGSKLYQTLEKQLLDKGIQSINLLTLKGDMTEIFYQRNGFTQSNRIIFMDKHLVK